MVVRQRGDHRNADEQHRQDHRRHRPVQYPGEQRELLGAHRWRYSRFVTHWRISVGVTALGCLVSPARLVNDCEYTDDRALSSGSSDGAMPQGSTSGSKLISRQRPCASSSTLSIVSVPTSI